MRPSKNKLKTVKINECLKFTVCDNKRRTKIELKPQQIEFLIS